MSAPASTCAKQRAVSSWAWGTLSGQTPCVPSFLHPTEAQQTQPKQPTRRGRRGLMRGVRPRTEEMELERRGKVLSLIEDQTTATPIRKLKRKACTVNYFIQNVLCQFRRWDLIFKVLMQRNCWHHWWFGLHEDSHASGKDGLSRGVICIQKTRCWDGCILSAHLNNVQTSVSHLFVFSITTHLPTYGEHFLLFSSVASSPGCQKQLAHLCTFLLMTFLMLWVSSCD